MELESTVQWSRELFIIKAKLCFCRNTKWERRGKLSVRCWRSSSYTRPRIWVDSLCVYWTWCKNGVLMEVAYKTAFLSLKFTHTQPARAWRLGYKLCLRSGAWSWLQSCSIFPCLAVFSYRSGHKTISVHAIAALFQLCVVLGFSWCGGPRTLNFWTSICFILENSFFSEFSL